MARRFTLSPASALALALLALAALPALSGCGLDASRVLARAGPRTITRDEFVEAARGNEAQYAGTPDSAKALLIQDLVRRALLLDEAERRGLFRDTLVVNYRRLVADEVLMDAVFERLSPRNIPVSEAEVGQLYAWRDTAAHARLIYTVARSAADAAIAELARGTGFATVADRFSPPGLLPPGGDLGFTTPGSLVAPLDHYLRVAPLQQTLGPLEAPGQGWFILQVLERQPRPQPPLDPQQRFMLRDMLRQRKQRLLALRAVADLRETFAMRLEPGGTQSLFAYLNRSLAPLTPGMGQSVPPQPSPDELGAVLARYDSGRREETYTLSAALADLAVANRERPNPTMLHAIERWIESQVVRRLALLEARRRHLDQEEAVARRITQRVDNYVLNAFYNSEIAPRADVTPADLRAAHERMKDAFQRLDQVRLLVATLADSAAASAVVLHAGHAPSLREAVEMAAPGTPVTEETVRFPDAPARWKPYSAAFMSMRPRECVGPVRAERGWLVAQLVSKVQGPQAYENLPPAIIQYLQQQAAEYKRDRVLEEVVTALKQTFPTEIYAERLQQIPWPVPPAAGSTS